MKLAEAQWWADLIRKLLSDQDFVVTCNRSSDGIVPCIWLTRLAIDHREPEPITVSERPDGTASVDIHTQGMYYFWDGAISASSFRNCATLYCVMHNNAQPTEIEVVYTMTPTSVPDEKWDLWRIASRGYVPSEKEESACNSS